MARDLVEQERAFILALSSDTGRDLDAWMQAIAASGHEARNDIIDWLRHQGFSFSNASWLERIHHNGGQLIYAGGEPRGTSTGRATQTPPKPSSELAAPAQSHSATGEHAAPEPAASGPGEVRELPETRPPAQSAPHPAGASDAEIAALLLAAKGLRPLADFMLREMDQIVPAMVRFAAPPLLTLASPMPFAALLPAPKEIRLFADFGPQSRDRTRKADSPRFPVPFPDVLILNDARQIDERFRELIAQAYTRALT